MSLTTFCSTKPDVSATPGTEVFAINISARVTVERSRLDSNGDGRVPQSRLFCLSLETSHQIGPPPRCVLGLEFLVFWEILIHGLSESFEISKLRRSIQDSGTSGFWQGIVGKELGKSIRKREQVIALDVVHGEGIQRSWIALVVIRAILAVVAREPNVDPHSTGIKGPLAFVTDAKGALNVFLWDILPLGECRTFIIIVGL